MRLKLVVHTCAAIQGARRIPTPPSRVSSSAPDGKNCKGHGYRPPNEPPASFASDGQAAQEKVCAEVSAEERYPARPKVGYASSEGPTEVSLGMMDAPQRVLKGLRFD